MWTFIRMKIKKTMSIEKKAGGRKKQKMKQASGVLCRTAWSISEERRSVAEAARIAHGNQHLRRPPSRAHNTVDRPAAPRSARSSEPGSVRWSVGNLSAARRCATPSQISRAGESRLRRPLTQAAAPIDSLTHARCTAPTSSKYRHTSTSTWRVCLLTYFRQRFLVGIGHLILSLKRGIDNNSAYVLCWSLFSV